MDHSGGRGGPAVAYGLYYSRYNAVRGAIHSQVRSLSTHFTTGILDCMAGVESWWDPGAVNPAGTRRGLYQFSQVDWEEWQGALPPDARKAWSEVDDAQASTYVAIVALEVRVGIYLRNNPNMGREELIRKAVGDFGEGADYARAIDDCARVIATDFQAAVEVIRGYHTRRAGGP